MVLRVLELTYTSEEMAGVANGLGYQGPPYVWDDPLHCFCSELDAVFTGMYGLKRFDLDNYGLFWPIGMTIPEAQQGNSCLVVMKRAKSTGI